jgi:hypothetical protein
VNWPSGNLFLGDGGAYLLGMCVAWTAVLLVMRHSEINGWAGVMVCAYPLLEAGFSMRRRSKRSMKKMGKEVGSASVYAKPHNMSGKETGSDIAYKTDPNTMPSDESTPGGMSARRVSAGNPATTQINKNGEMKIRGTGAATKGVMSRGPMA